MNKGFTLVELLVVIGILAVLATAAIVVLNPAQLLAQSRDTARMSDLRTIKRAVIFFMSSVPSQTLTATTTAMVNSVCGLGAGTCAVNSSTSISGGGWVAVNLTAMTTGSFLATLPRDPLNNADYQYAYAASSTASTFELNARLESEKYRTLMTSDGGNKNDCSSWIGANCYYEIGNAPGLNL